jgi:ribulose-5-phosphate 4-epimerase/fuculose-1-phosphate aldolase
MLDEGYIKFNSTWHKQAFPSNYNIETLNYWRTKLYQNGLIGAYPNGIGFGNVSQRTSLHQFVISGTQTGNSSSLQMEEYALVTSCDIAKNSLECVGMTQASSESMSHFAIYQCAVDIQFVFHIHHKLMWESYQNILPTTRPAVAYGTPEMCTEINRLFKESSVKEKRIFITAGHEEGVFAFGKTPRSAADILFFYLEKLYIEKGDS